MTSSEVEQLQFSREKRLIAPFSPLAFAGIISLGFAVLGYSDLFKYSIFAFGFIVALRALVSSKPFDCIPYMVLLSQFDTPFMYLHAGLGLRIWYVPFIAITFRYLLRYPFSIRIVFFLTIAFSPALIASNGSGLVFFAKWLVFYICPVLLISSGAGISLGTRATPSKDFLMAYVFPNVIMLGLIGLCQIVGNVLDGAGNSYYPPGDGWDIRPWGTYSETTWFGEFFVLAFSMTLPWLASKIHGFKRKSLITTGLLILQFLLAAASVSRNIFVGFGVLGILRPRFGLLLGGFTMVALLVLSSAGVLEGRLSLTGSSTQGGMGRVEAFKNEIRNLSLEPKGFDWDDTETTNEGNAMGSRSFNSLLFLMNSCGAVYGFILAASAFLAVVFFKGSLTLGDTAPLAIFVAMSMFAPLHFYPAFSVMLGVVICQFVEPWKRNRKPYRGSTT